ncbi:MAG: AMP-binding protein, partial [Acidimicrobiales bacterium]|nr:AMP-binding protein [Acidimicrobiales bacterium]
MAPTWQLRSTAADLAQRYRAEGLWTDETLGQLLDGHLRAQAALDVRVWSATRPWSGTIADVHGAARRFAGWLADNGVGAGDVVAFQLPNCVEAAVVFWGSALAGAVLVPIVHFYGPKEVGFIVDQLTPAVLVHSAGTPIEPADGRIDL